MCRHATGQRNGIEYIDGTGDQEDLMFGKEDKGKHHHHHHHFRGEDSVASAVAGSGGFQVFNDLISGHSAEQHIGETEDNDDNNDADDFKDNRSMNHKDDKSKKTNEIMLKRRHEQSHHSDDAVHDDQADEIQETVDSG